MPNLEQLIAEWRRALSTRNVDRESLDELESHLRETAEQLVRTGLAESAAFQCACKQLGGISTIGREFQKLRPSAWLPLKLTIGAGAVTALGCAILSLYIFAVGRSSLLLAIHVFLVTLGYTTTFLLGALGICFVVQRSVSDFSLLRLRSVTRVTFLFGSLAAGLTVGGIILGMIWAKTEWGRYWAWDVKETSALCIFLWQVCFLFAHRLARQTVHTVLVMSILGNIIVGLGWFGTSRLAESYVYGIPGWPLLSAGAFLNLALFLMGFAPPGWLRLRKAS